MKKSLLVLPFFLGSLAHAGFWWDLKKNFAKGIGCKTNDCASTIQVPDKAVPKKLALTFDDGPSSALTPKVLDILERHHIKATFFVLGKNVANNREIIRKALEQGHVIGSHSWDHPNFWKLNEDEIEAQILNTEKALENAGVKVKYFRFPNGNSTGFAMDLLNKRGYKVVGWHVDTCDWGFNNSGVLSAANNYMCNGVEKEVQGYQQFVLGKIKKRGGGVVLMHDVKNPTVENLEEVLTKLESEGYEFVQINDTEVFPELNK